MGEFVEIWRVILGLIPLIAFYIAERYWSLEAGIVIAMVFAIGELTYHRLVHGTWNRLVLFTVVLVVGLGSLSLLSEDERFMLVSPAIGDGVLAVLLGGALALGRNPLAELIAEQLPDEPIHALQLTFFRGVAWRFAANLAVHGALTVWSMDQSRETWLFVSGPAQYAMMGAQITIEAVYARFILLPRVEAAEAAEAATEV